MQQEQQAVIDEEYQSIQKTIKSLQEDKDKMRKKITKLLQRKGNIDGSIKTCKNCAKDYTEAENFNWSCRIHTSEFGGEMWWCCGKRGKDQPGCKFGKHLTKPDDEESDEQEQQRK